LAEKIGILAFQPISSKFNWKVIVEMAKGKEDFKFVAKLKFWSTIHFLLMEEESL
jgi:hypothetical protein